MHKKQFVEAYNEFSDDIFRHCYFRVWDRELAKDLVQEAYKKVWEYMLAGNKIKNIRAFLYRVATNLIIDHKRKVVPFSLDKLLDKGFEPASSDHEKLITNLEVQSVIKAIKGLDEKYSQLVLLRYVDGFTPREIAKILGERENAVSVRLHRALKKVRKVIGRRDG